MARSKRYHRSGSSYHVMLRGNDGQDIFLSDRDRCKMCMLLQHGVEKYDHRIHAFCLMKNHIHLLIQAGNIPLSKIVQNLAFRYSQDFNRRKNRIGHLFQGRFKAVLIDENSYFLRLLRYIHMNPVRAKLVQSPEEYVWSGHNTYIGKSEISWLTIDYGLSKFNKIKGNAQTMYSTYVLKKESQEETDQLRKGFRDGQLLGDDEFVKRIKMEERNNEEKKRLPLSAIFRAVCQVIGITEEEIVSSSKLKKNSCARAILAKIAKETGKIPLEDIANLLKRDASSISSLISRLSTKIKGSAEMEQIFEESQAEAIRIAEFQA